MVMTPLDYIHLIADSFHGAEHVYTMGSCYQFYKILKAVFPEAEAYSDNEHVITKIGSGFYDITGPMDPKGYTPIIRHAHYNTWKFDFWSCGLECPQCDEMVCYSGLVHKQQKIDYSETIYENG
jgi:hypothetical protein